MSFVYPSFLFGLLALSIPIIIHLFNFRRTKKVYFSNNQFLKNVKKATTSKLQIKHLLILLARLAFITFLVLAFAQPFIPGKNTNAAAGRKMVYLYLDNSLSMSSELASGVRGIDQGVSYINEIVARYPQNTEYKLLTNDFGNFSRVPKGNEELNELAAEVSLTSVPRRAEEILSKIRSDINTDVQTAADASYDVYLISDFQQSTMGNLQPLREDTTAQINLVPITTSFASNVYVDSVYLANPFMLAEQANELSVSIRNEGREPVTDLIVRLLINDQQVANASLDVGAFTSDTLNFTLNFPLEAQNRCQLVFEDYPVTFDNEFFFTLNLGDKISVLEITQGQTNRNADQPTNVAQVYANEALFDFQSFSINNLDYSLIENTNLLVLNELGNVPEETRAAIMPYLQNFIENGGHLVFVMPASGDISFLKAVTGNRSLTAERVPLPDSSQIALSNPDLANPFFSNMFEENADNFEMPAAVPLVNHNLRGETLLSYRNGNPYLLSLQGPGAAPDQFFVFTTPLRQDFTSLYRHAIFVPVMYRLASSSKSLDVPLYYSTDRPLINLRVASLAGDSIATGQSSFVYKLQHDEQEIVPQQRVINQRLVMEVPTDVVEAGFYALTRTAEANRGDSEQPLLTLSFNISQTESQVEQYGAEALEAVANNTNHINVFEADDTETFAALMQSREDGTALWQYALALALFFLLVEVLLIRFL